MGKQIKWQKHSWRDGSWTIKITRCDMEDGETFEALNGFVMERDRDNGGATQGGIKISGPCIALHLRVGDGTNDVPTEHMTVIEQVFNAYNDSHEPQRLKDVEPGAVVRVIGRRSLYAVMNTGLDDSIYVRELGAGRGCRVRLYRGTEVIELIDPTTWVRSIARRELRGVAPGCVVAIGDTPLAVTDERTRPGGRVLCVRTSDGRTEEWCQGVGVYVLSPREAE